MLRSLQILDQIILEGETLRLEIASVQEEINNSIEISHDMEKDTRNEKDDEISTKRSMHEERLLAFFVSSSTNSQSVKGNGNFHKSRLSIPRGKSSACMVAV